MAIKQYSAFCPTCGRQSLFQRPGINHVLHLILSLVTVGLWVIVWLILVATNSAKKPRCATCGMEMPTFGTFKAPVPHQPQQQDPHPQGPQQMAPGPEQPHSQPPPQRPGARPEIPEPED